MNILGFVIFFEWFLPLLIFPWLLFFFLLILLLFLVDYSLIISWNGFLLFCFFFSNFSERMALLFFSFFDGI